MDLSPFGSIIASFDALIATRQKLGQRKRTAIEAERDAQIELSAKYPHFDLMRDDGARYEFKKIRTKLGNEEISATTTTLPKEIFEKWKKQEIQRLEKIQISNIKATALIEMGIFNRKYAICSENTITIVRDFIDGDSQKFIDSEKIDEQGVRVINKDELITLPLIFDPKTNSSIFYIETTNGAKQYLIKEHPHNHINWTTHLFDSDLPYFVNYNGGYEPKKREYYIILEIHYNLHPEISYLKKFLLNTHIENTSVKMLREHIVSQVLTSKNTFFDHGTYNADPFGVIPYWLNKKYGFEYYKMREENARLEGREDLSKLINDYRKNDPSPEKMSHRKKIDRGIPPGFIPDKSKPTNSPKSKEDETEILVVRNNSLLPTPDFFSIFNPHEIKGEEKYTLPENKSSRFVELATRVPIITKGQYLVIPTPPNYFLDDLKVQNKSGETLVLGKHVHLHKIRNRDGYFLVFSEKRDETYHFVARFQKKEKVSRVDERLKNFDIQQIASLGEKIETLEFSVLHNNLIKVIESIEKRGVSLSAEFLSEIFGESARYSYRKEQKKPRAEHQDKILGEYTKFWDPDGYMFAQCDGGNNFYRDVVSLYLEQFHDLTVEVETGFHVDVNSIRVKDLHAKTIFYKDDLFNLAVDATPRLPDNYRKPNRFFEFFGLEKKDLDIPQISNSRTDDKVARVMNYVYDLEEAQKKMDAIFQEIRPKIIEKNEPFVIIRKLSRLLKDYINGSIDIKGAQSILEVDISDAESLFNSILEKMKKEQDYLSKYQIQVQAGQGISKRYTYYRDPLLLASINDLILLVENATKRINEVDLVTYWLSKN